MLNVYITIDTEIWCGGWNDLDRTFPDAFQKYVYGPTAHGDYALPATISILNDHGLTGAFFVEPLFSARFGIEPLKEIVGLIQAGNQEIQLHLHSEWVDVAHEPLLENVSQKLCDLTYCDGEQQSHLIKWGLERLAQAGANEINAFRAGSYAANQDTLRAVAQNGLSFDTSYNLGAVAGVHDMAPGEQLVQPRQIEGLTVFPVSVLKLKDGGYRNVQITALSFRELTNYLERAYAADWDSVVIVSHNFEMLTPDKAKVDQLTKRRFVNLCKYLEKHSDRFCVKGFKSADPANVFPQPQALAVNPVLSGMRLVEQTWRHICYG
ncbi:MAG: hypothetical protein NTV43_04335 [Methylococcales bacterium]|nr:hypothetical protein [Methylococcales bacterium]